MNEPCLLRNKSLHRPSGFDACSDYIVKRRYVWKLPGVEDGRKAVGDVRAQSCSSCRRSSRSATDQGLEKVGSLLLKACLLLVVLGSSKLQVRKDLGILVFLGSTSDDMSIGVA